MSSFQIHKWLKAPLIVASAALFLQAGTAAAGTAGDAQAHAAALLSGSSASRSARAHGTAADAGAFASVPDAQAHARSLLAGALSSRAAGAEPRGQQRTSRLPRETPRSEPRGAQRDAQELAQRMILGRAA